MRDDVHQYIFIENPKAASSSVKQALMGYENVPSPDDPRIGTITHKLPSELKIMWPEQWATYKKFVVVRNTWDRAYSFFNYYKNDVGVQDYQSMSFDQWVKSGCLPPDDPTVRSRIRIFHPDTRTLCQQRYTVEVDEIIVLNSFDSGVRHQQLLTGLRAISEEFHLPVFDLPPNKNRSTRAQPYVWNAASVEKIAALYGEEIERFGFVPPATGQIINCNNNG